MTTLTLSLDQLAAGDVITGVVLGDKPLPLPKPRTIEGTRREDGALRMVHPNPDASVEWWLYPDQADAWVVDRPAAPSAHIDGEPTGWQLAKLATAVPRWRTWTRSANQRGGWSSAQTLDPPSRYQLVEDPQVGDIVLTPSGDYYRAAVVTKVGPKRVKVTYTTPHSVEENRRYGTGIGTTNPYVSRGSTYAVPASASWLPKL